jgi:biotin operon repressor
MDSLITAAARALAAGNPFGALNFIALRDDAPALALRGIAMAQLGNLPLAKTLLRRATRAFSPLETLARARCIVAEAEVALASRDLHWSLSALDAARQTLERHHDALNAAHARLLEIRRLLLIGQLASAATKLAALDPKPLPPALRAAHALATAGIALRHLKTKAARKALDAAERAAQRSGIPALMAEVANTHLFLRTPAARLVTHTTERPLLLEEVEALLASKTLVVDACRHAVHQTATTIPLATRPVLFALVRALAQAWPDDVPRDALIAQAFRTRHADDSHRIRLRVELGRLRKALRPLANISATQQGFRLQPLQARKVAVVARPGEEKHAAVLALLADGEAWSSSALALALDLSQRSVQRALDDLESSGKVQAVGHGRGRRWTTPPIPGFTPILLLLAPLPGG